MMQCRYRKNPLHVSVQPQQTFGNALYQNIKKDTLEPNQTVATFEDEPSNAITAARTPLAGHSGFVTMQIDFYTEEPSEEQIIDARQCTRIVLDLVTTRKQSKHNNPP
ncbi:MAG: hypothetical protein EZS28_038383 [Streblomastix strix]|uniref:Uncharacterized protein n=1 Tax=Streblomastix strix TaxID=222440 RepID=A0A5J4U756_9EUKA|nr:MAG: hypothetical protein EZS28_038383 [Streblomastix strix]